MLTEEEKLKIRRKEQFKYEIRDELEKQFQNKNSKLIQFFNSNLGLFILSSILISGITFIYDRYSERQMNMNIFCNG